MDFFKIFDQVICLVIKICNLLIEHVLNNILALIAFIINLLPSFPIESQPLDWGVFGTSIGYFLPLGTMTQHFVLLLGLMAVWYAIEYVMRWIKMIK